MRFDKIDGEWQPPSALPEVTEGDRSEFEDADDEFGDELPAGFEDADDEFTGEPQQLPDAN